MEGTSALLSNYATPCHCQPACKQQEERINCLGLCPHYRPNYANILARSTGARTAVRGDCVKFSAWSSEVRMSGTDGGKKRLGRAGGGERKRRDFLTGYQSWITADFTCDLLFLQIKVVSGNNNEP